MAKKTLKAPNFRTTVVKNVEKQKSETNYGYHLMPKGVELFKEVAGEVALDIIPYEVTNARHMDRDEDQGIAVPETLWYRAAFRVHRSIGAGNGDTVVCPRSFGKKCPICEYREQRQAEGAAKEELEQYYTSKRSLYAVLPDHKNYDDKIYVWDVSDHFAQNLINDEIQLKPEKANFPALDGGFTLVWRFSEESFSGKKYFKPTRVDFEEREEALDTEILTEVPLLDDILKVIPYKELQAMLFQMDPEDIEDDDDVEEEEETPQRSKRSSGRRAKSTKVEEEIEEDEEEEIEEEEEEEEVKPKRGRGKKPAPVVEEEEEEEEEVVKPKRGRSTAKKEPVVKGLKSGEEVKKKSSGGKCPHGYTWGEDNDEHEECDDCDLWSKCLDAQE